MLEVAKVSEGDTVVVSAAAGATGSAAAEIARIQGARVLGIAGTEEKCRWLTDDVGLDGAINHRTEDIVARLRELAPKRVDVFFDNVGGEVLNAVMARLAMHARVVLCGHIASYNDTEKAPRAVQLRQPDPAEGNDAGLSGLRRGARFPEIGETLRKWHEAGRSRADRALRGSRQRRRRTQRNVHRGQHGQDRDARRRQRRRMTSTAGRDTDLGTQQGLAEIHEQGYTVLRSVISADEADAYVEDLARIESDLGTEPAANAFEGTQTRRVYNLLRHGKPGSGSHRRRVLPVVEGVLGRGCLISLSSIGIGPERRRRRSTPTIS